MADEEIDLTVIISLTFIATSIIFAMVLQPSLSNNSTFTTIIYIIVTSIASLLGVVIGKNTK